MNGVRRAPTGAARLAAVLFVAACLLSSGQARTARAQDASGASPLPGATSGADPTSTASTVGFVLLGAAGASLATGIGFGVASVVEHRRSRDILEEASGEDEEDLGPHQAAYADAVSARDDLRVVSGLTAGVGLGLFVVAGALFAIDEASDEAGPTGGPAVSAGATRVPTSVVAAPAIGPGFTGASATLRF